MTSRTGRTRLILSLAAVCATGAALTTAALSDSAEVLVTMDGSQNRFDIQTTGSYGADAAAWMPTASDWQQGNPDAYELSLGPNEQLLSPGAHLDGRIAVTNASPRLSALVSLSIEDPQPRGAAVDPATGNFVELFDQLRFTVTDGGAVLLNDVPAADLATYTWPAPFAPGDEKVLDVRITMSPQADNRWQLASTDIRFHFEGVTP